jgi:hypothetical protein
MSGVEPTAQRTWRQVAVVVDGRDIPIGRSTLMTIGADGYTITVGGTVYQKGTAQANLEKTPHALDVLVAKGPQVVISIGMGNTIGFRMGSAGGVG